MKRICSFSIIHYIIMGLFISLTNSCTTEVDPKLLPVLTSTDVTKITEASAQTGGNITSDAGSDIISRGVCWGTSPNPTIENNKTSDAAGTGLFTSKLTGLTPSTIYYVRAYATNKKGTGYGLQVTFSTKSLSLITTAVTSITINSAKSGGTIATDGDSVNVSARGICWGIQSNPTIADSKTTDGKGGGKYISSLTDLILGTTYYVRAYVTNSGGTIYGNEVSFITQDGAMTLTTTPASSITATSATVGGSVPNDGGASVIERGLCLSKLPTPTITNKIANGSGTGSYASNITGLEANTTYYVRAYATNSVNTNYGNEISFTTKDGIVALTTIAATTITATSATIGGTITSDGGATITARGICWSKTTNPTTADGKSTNTGAIGSFSTNVTGLTIGAKYYVRSYATNSVGTSYGNEISFTTLDGKIILTTTSITAITALTANSGGNISSDGGVTVTARGVCWNTYPNPTTGNYKTTNSTGSGVFTSNLVGLKVNTTYYVRAYATNSEGTSYGNELSFTTQNGVIILTTSSAFSVTALSATSGGNIISDGGGVIVTDRGVCWNTSPNPTTENYKTSNGAGTGIFTSNLTGLKESTIYYARAYATNSVGTVYGNEVSFTTQNGIITLSTVNITSITSISSKSGGTITTDGGAPVTMRGVCWSTNSNPTITNYKTTDATGIGSFTSSISGLTLGVTYYVRAYATNAVDTYYGNELVFTTILALGDSYQGGKIAYFLKSGDTGYIVGETHGIIAAPSDQSISITWISGTNYPQTNATSTGIGTGEVNTNLIINTQGEGNYAAKLCSDLILNGYSDWYLPSKDELNTLYINRQIVGGFANNDYWSSSELSNNLCWIQNFTKGFQSNSEKYINFNGSIISSLNAVRAIRNF